MTSVKAGFNSQAKNAKSVKKRSARTAPLSIRFTPDEREYLERKAGRMPVGTYVRDSVLEVHVKAKRRTIGKTPGEKQELISKVFSAWTETHLPHNLGQFFLATQNSPQLFTSELCMVILGAKNDAEAIRKTLMEVGKTCRISNVTLLTELLGRLRQGSIPKKFNQVVLSIHIGAFVLSPEVHALILEVCAEIDAICTMLHKAVEIG